jgi:hypothetical protein
VATKIKITEKILEDMILEEMNELSDSNLQELSFLSKLKGGFKGIKQAASAGAERQVESDFIKKYVQAFLALHNELYSLPDQMIKDAGKYNLDIQKDDQLAGLVRRIKETSDDLESSRKEIVGIAKSLGMDIDDPGAEVEADAKAAKTGIASKAGSAIKGIGKGLFGISEETGENNNGDK